jgi:hypothetical protein
MNSHPVPIVLTIAVAAPLLAEIPIGVRLPAVVLEMVLGIIIGPQVLGLATAKGLLGWLGGKLGLAALYGHDLAKGQRLPFALYSATALPLLVAISAIGVQTGRMHPEIAAALIGAGMLSVLLFPTFAGVCCPGSLDLHPSALT